MHDLWDKLVKYFKSMVTLIDYISSKKQRDCLLNSNLAVHNYEYLQTSQLYMDFTSASCYFESLARWMFVQAFD